MDQNRAAKSSDPFLLNYQPSELRIASEFLTTWLPFLSRDLCPDCFGILANRIRSLDPDVDGETGYVKESEESKNLSGCDEDDANSLGSWKDAAEGYSEPQVGESSKGETGCDESPTSGLKMSWADMAAEDDAFEGEGLEDGEEEGESGKRLVSVDGKTGGLRISKVAGENPQLSSEQRERIRFTNVERKKDFICLERVNGRIVNVLDGLELHKGVFSAAEQRRIVDLVYKLKEKGGKGELKDRTYSAPAKWMRGKGRVTLQFGCCYNYATDKNGNPPGIHRNAAVDPIPHLFKVMIRRMVKWHVLPPTCVPDSCIVNIYEEGDCIPPHIDNHDFVRPFCTVSFLSECNIVFGTNLKIVGPGEFAGSIAIPLPVGSVLVLNGNGADVAKHCVPAVPTKRISITFRRMDESKRPAGYVPEPDLQEIEPLSYARRSSASRYENRTSWQEGRREGYSNRGRVFSGRRDTRSGARISNWSRGGRGYSPRGRMNCDG